MKVTAKVQRSGDWWAVEVPEVPGVFTQARRLDQVADQVADAVATVLDDEVLVADIEVEIEPVLPADQLARLRGARGATAAALEAQLKASAAMRSVVLELRERFSVRDVAALLGISHQRVSQLEVNAKAAEELARPVRRTSEEATRIAGRAAKVTKVSGGTYRTKAEAAAAGRRMVAAKSRSTDAAAKARRPK